MLKCAFPFYVPIIFFFLKVETNKVKNRMLFNKIRQYNHIFNKIIFFKYRTREVMVTKKISKLLTLTEMGA